MPEIKINNTVYECPEGVEYSLPDPALEVIKRSQKIEEDFDGFMYLGQAHVVPEQKVMLINGKYFYISGVIFPIDLETETIYRVVYNGQEYFSEWTTDHKLGNLGFYPPDENGNLAENTGEPFLVEQDALISLEPNPNIKIYIQTRFPDIQPGMPQYLTMTSFGSNSEIFRLADMIRKKCPLYLKSSNGINQIISLDWSGTCGALYLLKIGYSSGTTLKQQTVNTIRSDQKDLLEGALSSL